MPNAQIDPIMSPMQRTVTRNLLKYAAGQTMFCPGCSQCMDWRRTMILDVTKDSAPIRTMVLCTTCADKGLLSLEALCKEKGLTLEVTDGRKLK